MLRFALLLLVSIVGCLPTYGQDYFNNYTPLRSQGQVPTEIISAASIRYQQSVAHDREHEANAHRRERGERERFLLNSTFVIDELLSSGKVLFNDTVSRYVNRVADRLLANDPTTRAKLKFLVVKSLVANAFAYDGGFIFVNIGLLSRLHNEAELAFVLAHEIVHYQKQHGMERYVEGGGAEADEESRNRNRVQRRSSIDERLLNRHAFSRAQETEADEEGLELFLAAGYTSSAVEGVFNVLLHSTEMFIDLPITSDLLRCGSQEFPEGLIPLPNVLDTAEAAESDDSHSTHPNIATRRRTTAEAIAGRNVNGISFSLPADAFFFVRNIARFEMVRLYFLNRLYPEAIYSGNCLLNEFPANSYLSDLVVNSYYAMGCYGISGNARQLFEIRRHDLSGNFSSYLKSVYRLPSYALATYSLAKLNELKSSLTSGQIATNRYADLSRRANLLTGDPFWEAIADSTQLTSLVDSQRVNFRQRHEEHNSNVREMLAQREDSPPRTANNRRPRRGESELGRNVVIKDGNNTYIDTLSTAQIDSAFVADSSALFTQVAYLMGNELFRNGQLVREELSGDNIERERELLGTMWSTNFSEDSPRKVSRRANRNSIVYNSRMLKNIRPNEPIERVTILNPSFWFADLRKRDALQLLSGENLTNEFRGDINAMATENGVQVSMLAPKELNSSDIERFNEYARLTEWCEERMAHTIFIPPVIDTLEQLSAGTNRHVAILTGQAAIYKRPYKGLVMMLCIPYFVTIPYGIWYCASPLYISQYTGLVFDTETGRYVSGFSHTLRVRNRRDVRHSTLYNWFRTLKRTPQS